MLTNQGKRLVGMDSTKKTIREVLLGIAIYLLVASVPVLIFTNDKVKGEGGLLIGGAAAVLMLYSMKLSITKAMHMQKGHSSYLGFTSVARMLLVVALLGVIGWTGWLNLVTTFVGLISLKFATYMQPFTEKLITKATNKKQGR